MNVRHYSDRNNVISQIAIHYYSIWNQCNNNFCHFFKLLYIYYSSIWNQWLRHFYHLYELLHIIPAFWTKFLWPQRHHLYWLLYTFPAFWTTVIDLSYDLSQIILKEHGHLICRSWHYTWSARLSYKWFFNWNNWTCFIIVTKTFTFLVPL